jgi:hypothetical protein
LRIHVEKCFLACHETENPGPTVQKWEAAVAGVGETHRSLRESLPALYVYEKNFSKTSLKTLKMLSTSTGGKRSTVESAKTQPEGTRGCCQKNVLILSVIFTRVRKRKNGSLQ